jgi:hypothetical protein
MLSIYSLAEFKKALVAMQRRWEREPTVGKSRKGSPKAGADAQDRTADLLITNQLLYR